MVRISRYLLATGVWFGLATGCGACAPVPIRTPVATPASVATPLPPPTPPAPTPVVARTDVTEAAPEPDTETETPTPTLEGLLDGLAPGDGSAYGLVLEDLGSGARAS